MFTVDNGIAFLSVVDDLDNDAMCRLRTPQSGVEYTSVTSIFHCGVTYLFHDCKA